MGAGLWQDCKKVFEDLWGAPVLLSLILSSTSPFSCMSLSFAICTVGQAPQPPRVRGGLQATLGPPTVLPSPRFLSVGSSVTLYVVSLENQRLTFFRLPWLLLVLLLGLRWARGVSRASP